MSILGRVAKTSRRLFDKAKGVGRTIGKISNVASKVLPYLPKGKYTDIARDVVGVGQKIGEFSNKSDAELKRDVLQKGARIVKEKTGLDFGGAVKKLAPSTQPRPSAQPSKTMSKREMKMKKKKKR
jgi:hypothetical protein